ncbi:branched-chain amino acid ABC transporter permease [Streptomyces sp. NPDC006476]|uniref:branched-chain amino acid ABC transporter permease n=1 Tax=Streptomyces sp. NPDC006476 TaxID=3157175 RepID=UPI0033A8772C
MTAKPAKSFEVSQLTGFPKDVVIGSLGHRLWQGIGLLLAVVCAVVPALLLNDAALTPIAQVVPYAVAVLGLNLVTGWTGQVSLGHAAFFGAGAYTVAVLCGDRGWPWGAAVPAAAVAGAALGFLVGIPALRLRGLYLAVVTLAVGVAFPVLLTQPFALELGTGGVGGKTTDVGWHKPAWFGLNVTDFGWRYLVAATVAGVLFWLAAGLVRGRTGRSLIAVRDHETAARVCGVWPAGVRTGAFAVSAAYGALGGALYILITPTVSPGTVGFQITLLFITAMVLGGSTTVAGAWIGGAAMVFLPQWTADWAGSMPGLAAVSSQPGLFSNAVYGLLLIAAVFAMPEGIAPFLTRLRARALRLVPREVTEPPPEAPDTTPLADPASPPTPVSAAPVRRTR